MPLPLTRSRWISAPPSRRRREFYLLSFSVFLTRSLSPSARVKFAGDRTVGERASRANHNYLCVCHAPLAVSCREPTNGITQRKKRKRRLTSKTRSGHLNAKHRELLELQAKAQARLAKSRARFAQGLEDAREVREDLEWTQKKVA